MTFGRILMLFGACIAFSVTTGCHARNAAPAQAAAAPSGKLGGGERRTGRAAAGEKGEPVDYIEYRVQPELGQMSILVGSIDGPRTADRLRKSADALVRRGILIC